MRTVKNIYAESCVLIAYIIPFTLLTHQLITNVSDGVVGFVDIMILLFNILLMLNIYLQYLTIRLYVWPVREKSHNVTSDK